MISLIAGIILTIAGILLWVGTITLIHAIAIFMVVIGVLLLLAFTVPAHYYYRKRV